MYPTKYLIVGEGNHHRAESMLSIETEKRWIQTASNLMYIEEPINNFDSSSYLKLNILTGKQGSLQRPETTICKTGGCPQPTDSYRARSNPVQAFVFIFISGAHWSPTVHISGPNHTPWLMFMTPSNTPEKSSKDSASPHTAPPPLWDQECGFSLLAFALVSFFNISCKREILGLIFFLHIYSIRH